jgi:hypothetical protein
MWLESVFVSYFLRCLRSKLTLISSEPLLALVFDIWKVLID